MLARGLDTAPEFEVHNENDRAAFDHYLLRSDVGDPPTIVMASKHQFVLFKPLCDSHRVDDLLDSLGTPSPGRAIWAYRDVDGRARSAVSKFGRNNLLVLGDIAAGTRTGMWQAQRLSEGDARADPQLRLHDDDAGNRGGALLVGSQRSLLRAGTRSPRRRAAHFVPGPAREPRTAAMQSICRFLGFPFRDRADRAHLTARPGWRSCARHRPAGSSALRPSFRTALTKHCACRARAGPHSRCGVMR